MRIKRFLIFSLFMLLCSNAYAIDNDIYITQSGDNLTLSITQDGGSNKVGDATTGVTITGATSSIDIDQIGDTNVISGKWIAATTTLDLDMTGDSNTLALDIDAGSSYSSSAINTKVQYTGGSNNFNVDIADNAAITTADFDVVMTGSSNTGTVNLDANGGDTMNVTATGSTNAYTVDQAGSGAKVLTHTHTGSNATIDIDQTGNNNNTAIITTSSASMTLTILQQD